MLGRGWCWSSFPHERTWLEDTAAPCPWDVLGGLSCAPVSHHCPLWRGCAPLLYISKLTDKLALTRSTNASSQRLNLLFGGKATTSLSASDTQCHTWWQMLGHDRGCGTVPTLHSPFDNQPCQLCVNWSLQLMRLVLLGWIFYKAWVHRPLPQGHLWPRGAENTLFLKSTEKSQKLSLTELPNWEISSFDSPATIPCAELSFWGGKVGGIWPLLPKRSNLRNSNKRWMYVSFLSVRASETRDSFLIIKVNPKKNNDKIFKFLFRMWRCMTEKQCGSQCS